jgi:hypothetical protein
MANLSNINNYFVVDSTGKVAIGDVSAATIPTLLTQLTLYDNTATASLVIQSGAASGKKYELGSSSTGKFQITDLDASVDRLTVDANGRVGIGTTSPIQKLDTPNIVIGGSTIAGTFKANSLFIDNNGGNSRFYSSGADGSTKGSYEFNIMASDGNPLLTPLVINNSGNVGIGTTSPAEKLTIDGTVSGAYVRISNAASGDVSSGYMIYNGNNLDFNVYTNPTFGNTTLLTREALAIRAGGAERMRIDSSGNVGIGTTSPVSVKSYTTLQVKGNIKVGDSNAAGLISLGDIASSGANAGIWRGAAGAYAGVGNFLNLGGYDGIAFTTGNADIASQTERLRLLHDGQFWIKLSSTTSGREASVYNDNDKLQIFGSRYGGTGKYVSIWSDGANENTRFYPTKTVFYKNVGIGTTSPSSKLTVYGGGATSSTLELRGAANGGDNATVSTQQSMMFQIGSAGATGRSFTFAKGGLGYSDGTMLFAIDSNGGTFNKNWAQTGTSSGTSIIQTTLIPEPGIYEFYLKGNPNAGGSAAYRSIQAGLITIACDYTPAQSVFLRIQKTVLAQQGGGSSNIQLNLNVYMLYNGVASGEQSFANKDASVIYLTVSNYAGTVGSHQELRITRKI